MSSIFSKIIAREIPARIVYEDDHMIAFLDINPVNPGHTLVVPKNEQPNVLESSEEDLVQVLRVVRLLAPAIVKAVGADGFNTVTNTGEASGQSVPHTHFHIIPRFLNDGHMPWAHASMSAEALDAVATKIKQAL
ncbi:HIT family protein [Candidatus Uhrbacteria bacterium]|nr:HIT family protein [Candidatus Uhrbacteria bacterium]